MPSGLLEFDLRTTSLALTELGRLESESGLESNSSPLFEDSDLDSCLWDSDLNSDSCLWDSDSHSDS